MLRVVRRHADLVSRGGLRQLEARVFRAWAAAHLADGHPRQALPKALQRLWRQPGSLQAWWIVSKSLKRIATSNVRPEMISSDGRDETALRRHFEIERELATRLRTADTMQRRSLYGVVYNELFARVPDHPQNTRKQSAPAQEAAARWQWRLLQKFVRRNSRYLELGAGDCHLAMDVARVSRWSYGVDVSNVIATNGNQPANFSLIISDGVHIDVPRASIDVAYSNQLMEHLHPDDAAAQLSQIRRALAPSGRYVCVTPHRYSGPHDVSQFFATEACGFHLKEYTYSELRDLLLQAGFGWTQVWTGVKGKYFRVPTSVIIGIERMLGLLPTRLRRCITRAPLFRMLFINVLLVGCAGGGKTQDEPIADEGEEIVASA
jgi:SAM-dependent methyltransferase